MKKVATKSKKDNDGPGNNDYKYTDGQNALPLLKADGSEDSHFKWA